MDGMANDIDQQLRDYQREYLDFIDDDVSIVLSLALQLEPGLA